MANLTAIPTQEGLAILNSELKSEATNFILIGDTEYANKELDALLESGEELTYQDVESYIFYSNSVESSYYDDNGVLTLNLIIPVDEDLESYSYAIAIVTSDNKLVTLTRMPKIMPIKGVGGAIVVKVAVKGTAGEIVFKKNEYITINEAQDLFLKPVITNTALSLALQQKIIDIEDTVANSWWGQGLEVLQENIKKIANTPDFDTGWMLIEAGHKHYNIEHNLNTNLLSIRTMLRATDSDKIFYNADNVQSLSHAGTKDDKSVYNGFSIEEIDQNIVSVNTANNYVFATDNSVQYGDAQYANGNALDKAYIRILINKLEE